MIEDVRDIVCERGGRMRFIVCAKERESGETFVVGGRSYPSKDEAIGALSGIGSVGLLGDEELFLVDLDATTPIVLVYPRQPVAAASPDLTADVEPPSDASDAEEFAWIDEVDEVLPASEPAPTDEDVPEGAGMTLPEPETDAATSDGDVTAVEGDGSIWPFVQSSDEGVGAPLFGDEIVISDADRSEVWWLEVGSEADETPARRDGIEAREPADGIPPVEVEPSSTHDDSLTDTVYEQAQLPVDEPAAVEECEELPAIAEAAGQASFADDPRLDEPMPEHPEAEVDTDVDADTHEATFVLVDFDAWTCGECVFTATCDKVDVDRPASCVSFQWNPE